MILKKHPRTFPHRLPAVTFSDEGPIRHLHLGDTRWIQGSICLDQPDVLVHDYVQRMMAWLLFVPLDSVWQRQALQLGLGAGSLTRFCAKNLGMTTTAIEINPQVVEACRRWFRFPADNAHLRVVLDDAASGLQNPAWHGQVDALQVDLYDHEAAGPVEDSLPFYRHCRQALSPDGCMTVNLFGRAMSFERSLDKISAVFGVQSVLTFLPTREGNTVVLARRTATPVPGDVLRLRADDIEARWGLDAPRWLRMLRPVSSVSPAHPGSRP